MGKDCKTTEHEDDQMTTTTPVCVCVCVCVCGLCHKAFCGAVNYGSTVTLDLVNYTAW